MNDGEPMAAHWLRGISRVVTGRRDGHFYRPNQEALMPTTRQPLPPATETLEAFHVVGSHVYMVRYRPGQEELARESIYRFSRNKELAFSWTDAAVMGEQVPYVPEPDEPCDCEACTKFADYLNGVPYDPPPTFYDYLGAVVWMGVVAAPWVLLVILGRFAWGKWGM